MRFWKEHPVLFSFSLGAGLGLTVAMAMATVCALQGSKQWVPFSVMVALWPTSILGLFPDSGAGPFAVLTTIAAEFVSNALLYGFVFALPVGGVITAQKSFGKPEKPVSIKSD